MNDKLQIKVFGKPGCAKCKVLNGRLDKLLGSADYAADFEKVYCDVESEPGLVEFCQAECINPQRIPAFVITRQDPASGRHLPLPRRQPGVRDESCGDSQLHQYVGLQTDYAGNGVLSSEMIEVVLREARELAG